MTIWAVFAVDYLTRLWLAPERWPFARTHVVDLIVVAVPFLRPFRLLRLVAIVMAASRRAGGLAVQRVTIYVAALTVIVMSVAAVVVYNQERAAPDSSITSLGDSFWWAAETVTTVGYGDAVPTTPVGRVFAALLMVTGIALVGTITAAVAAWFVNVVRSAATAPAAGAEADRQLLVNQIDRLSDVVEKLSAEVAALRSATRPPGAGV